MGKRKLRACTGCGGRHGPPTGKLCARGEEKFGEKNEEMSDEKLGVTSEAADGGPDSHHLSAAFQEGGDWVFPEYPEAPVRQDSYEDARPKFDFVCSPLRQPARTADTKPESAAKMADVGWDYEPRRRIGLTKIEMMMSDCMMRLENSMSEMAIAQKEQMEKLMAMFVASRSTGCESSKLPEAAGAAAAEPEDSSDSGSEDSDWKDFFGAEVWKKEKDRVRKNPFDHRNYGKRGDVVESFEQLMVVLFKTMSQLQELKYDLKGIIKHGLMMSEKAAKDVYIPEAFIEYDESVRKRGGQVGPTAFGIVDQEDVLRFFSCEYLKSKKAAGGSAKSSTAKKSKTCLRYNDGGCTYKNCSYQHKCIACEGWGHPKKDCRNVSASAKKSDAK